jgi:hypothetical protein
VVTKCNTIFFPDQLCQLDIALMFMDNSVQDFVAVVMSLWFCPNKIPVSRLLLRTKPQLFIVNVLLLIVDVPVLPCHWCSRVTMIQWPWSRNCWLPSVHYSSGNLKLNLRILFVILLRFVCNILIIFQSTLRSE